jgi:hypothetical protein
VELRDTPWVKPFAPDTIAKDTFLFDDGDAAAGTRENGCQCGTGHAAANNRDIEPVNHCRAS